MNDHLDLDDTDERGRRAGAAVMRAAQARPIPDLDPDALRLEPAVTGHHRRWRAGLAAAAALVVVAGGAVLWQRSTDDVGDTAPAQADARTGAELVPYLAAELPEGVKLQGAMSLDVSPDAASAVPLDVYGADPSSPAFGVAWFPDQPDGPDESRLELEGAGTESPSGTLTSIVQRPGGELFLVGRDGAAGLDAAALDRIGEQATFAADGSVVVPDDALPEGTRYLGTEPSVFSLSAPLFFEMQAAEATHVAVYAASIDEPERTQLLEVTTVRGDEARRSATLLTASSSEEVTVGGRPALLTVVRGSGGAGPWRIISWMDDAGQLVRVYGIGFGADELLDIAEGVRPATDDEWSDLERRTPRTGDEVAELESTSEATMVADEEPMEDVRTVRLGDGEFASGTSWQLSLEHFESGATGSEEFLSLEVDEVDSSSIGSSSASESGGEWRPFRGFTTTSYDLANGETRTFAAGLVSRDVVEVELITAEGRVPVTLVRAQGRVAWVLELPDPEAATFGLVALDADGRELGRETIDTGHGGSGDEPSSTAVAETVPPTTH